MIISQRTLRFGPYTLLPADTHSEVVPYFLAGRKMYFVGTTSGDLQPIGAEHLIGEMGGLWAHPMKVADGLTLRIAAPDGTEPMAHGVEVIESLSHIAWRYRLGGLEIQRRDFVAEDHAAYITLVTLRNPGAQPRTAHLHLQVWLKFLGCWFGGMTTGGGDYWLDDTVVVGYDRHWQGRWGVAFGSTVRPEQCRIEERAVGRLATLVYPFTLKPGETRSWEFMLTADHERGHEGARHMFSQLAGSGEQLLREKQALYKRKIFEGVALETPDKSVNRAFALAKANLQLLSADYEPNLPPYFLAGVPEYPQMFGCDTEYTVPGAAAVGYAPVAKSALLALADYAQRACGRIPHEVTTNGRVFNPGNTQETPQFASACWDYFRWTGDIALLRRVYPLCKEGVDEYLPAHWSSGSLYPLGDGMIERTGMGSRKLDSACYLYQALGALRDMADALELPDEAARYGARLAEFDQHFERDWWMEDEGMYADSLHSDGRPQLDGHWTVVLPLQLGLAQPEHAERCFARIEREWVNEWGLVHTKDREDSVWTLPTGLLALAAFKHGRAELGLRMLQNIAETANHGMLGAFKELIPIGLCFVQLWSAGLYTQGMIEGLMGLQPLAHLHRLAVAPCLPETLPQISLAALTLDTHTLSLMLTHTGITLDHHDGPQPLDLRYRLPADAGPLTHEVAHRTPPQIIVAHGARWVQIALDPGRQITISATAERVLVRVPDRRSDASATD